MKPAREERLARLAADTRSSATVLLATALEVLEDARQEGPAAVEQTARDVARATPAMASMRNAAAAALAGLDDGVSWTRFVRRLDRIPRVVADEAARLILGTRSEGRPPGPLRLVTCSASRSVEACLARLAAHERILVACAEGRPALEGQGLAARLAGAGRHLEVEFFTDAALATALAGADAVLIGADAVGPSGVVNKVGSFALAAAARYAGVPCYVAAGSDKFLPGQLFNSWPLVEGRPELVWPTPPEPVKVRNPVFELVPADLLAAVISDRGALADVLLPEATETPWGARHREKLVGLAI